MFHCHSDGLCTSRLTEIPSDWLYADRADYQYNTPLLLNVEGVKLAGKTFSVRCSRLDCGDQGIIGENLK